MNLPKLKVLPRGAVLAPHFESILAGAKRFIGRQWDAKHGPGGGWEPNADPKHPVEVPTLPEADAAFRELWSEYAREVREGTLWPADKATADACGVQFDKSFGGEFDEVDASPSFASHVGSAAEPTTGA